jgi:hypothetical protein
MQKNLNISCPECGHQFSPEAAVEGHLRMHLEKEYAQKLDSMIKESEAKAKADALEQYRNEIELLKRDAKAKSEKLSEMEKQSLQLSLKEKEILEREQRIEMEMQKKMLNHELEFRETIERNAREKWLLENREQEARMNRDRETTEIQIRKAAMEAIEKVREESSLKEAELQKKLDDQIKLAAEMNRRGRQGSMQLQGEVQEIAMEEFLKASFVRDEIDEIGKGVRGADCIHVVKDNFGNECGRILYESKRSKSFSKDWISKLKEDMRLKQAHIGVIVTETMPSELSRFGQIDGIWICSFAEFKSMCFLFRYTLIKIGEVGAAQQNRTNKMQILYDYLTGNDFRQKIEAICESFDEMNVDLQKDKKQAFANFAKRERQILKAMENTVGLYGDVKGIAGGAIQNIPSLNYDDNSPEFLREVG